MRPPAPAGRNLDFAVLGNARDALRWLKLVLAALPEVRLVDGRAAAEDDQRLAGMVIDRLAEPAPGLLARRAERVALVLEDPIRLMAEQADTRGDDTPTGYAQALRRLTRADGEAPLVMAAEELLAPGSGVQRLLRHLGVSESVDGAMLAPVWIGPPPSLDQGRRSVLFASVRDEVESLEQLAGRTFRSWRFSDRPGPEPAGQRPAVGLFYIGRHRDQLAPPGLIALDEWDVLPVKLGPRLDAATTLTVLDPLSFPFDSLRDSDRAIPVAVRLPGGWSAEQLTALLGAPLLAHLGPFDVVSVDDDEIFDALRARYSWPARARASTAELTGFATRAALDPNAPLRRVKATDRALRAPVLAEIDKALDAVAPGERPRGIVVGRRIERWASLLPLGAAGLIGIDLDPENVRVAAASYPEWQFATEIPAETEVAHVAVSMLSLAGLDRGERRRRLRALFTGLRVGGRLVLVERFLDVRGGHRVDGPSPRELLAEVNDVVAGHLVLAEVQALRSDGEDLFGIGLFAFVKVGRPERE